MTNIDWHSWETHFEAFLRRASSTSDGAHDLSHIQRVVASAMTLALQERAELAVVVPAAWLHDCVVIPKDSPLRASASTQAAQAAVALLQTINYPAVYLDAIYHAIEAHSFSAGILPRTLEAQVVQDADRLDALGAIGIARCFVTAGAMGTRLYAPEAPFPHQRALDERANALDHFYAKLLRLETQMQTASGRAEARRRTDFMRLYLQQLAAELGVDFALA